MDRRQSQGYPRLVREVQDQPPVSIARSAHPNGEQGWCSNCGGNAPEGIQLTKACGAYFFFCIDCASRVAEAIAR